MITIGNNKIGILKDPFGKTQITDVEVSYGKSIVYDEWYARGSVVFKNGQTEGRQRFKGESFDDVVAQIKSFIQTLK